MRLRPAIYWFDFLASASLAWLAAVSIAWRPAMVWLAGPVATLATLRAAYFIHELSHFRRALRGLEVAWNLLVGLWITMPSFMADTHVDHHRPATFGTVLDPEYEPVATWTRTRLIASVASMVLVPPLLVLRFGVLGPLSLSCPPLRRLVWGRMSALQTNVHYVRHDDGRWAARTIALEVGATCVVGLVAYGSVIGLLPARAVFVWWVITASALAFNQARTLLAHGYVPLGRARTLAEQVADSETAEGCATLTELVYPVGTRFHAVHHLAPTLPYHALPAADRMLRRQGIPELDAGTHHGFRDGWRALWRRAGANTPRARASRAT